jgi:16S rRNA (cytosine1402-N4)-methyltransferase
MSEIEPENIHASVLLSETVTALLASGGDLFIDATLGLGGHTEALLRSDPKLKVVAFDQDATALALASERLFEFSGRTTFVHANFEELKTRLEDKNIGKVDGVMADLGVSSMQFDTAERGFSFRFDAPLDMRMDSESDNPTAAELLGSLGEEEIANIIYQYGEERASRRIARWIVQRRERGEPVSTTKELAALVERAIGRGKKEKIHPATRTFQALRIAVNRELEVLERFLRDGVEILRTDGRFAVITFHSLEDRIVKQTFQRLAGKCFCPPRIPRCICGAVKKIEIVTKKPLTPSDDELKQNPRSRSAKLRVVRRIADQ